MAATLRTPPRHHESAVAPTARLALRTDGTSPGLLDEDRRGVSATDEPLDPDEAWEYEGGASAVPATLPEQTGPPGRAGHLINGTGHLISGM